MNDIILKDLDMFGKVENGVIVSYVNKDALQNALLIWFTSRVGDRLRNPTRGGFLDFQITKQMDEDRLNNFRQRIRRALEKDFNDIFRVTYLDLSPDYNSRLLNVSLEVVCNSLQTNFELAVRVKAI